MKIEQELLEAIEKEKNTLAKKYGLYIQTINRWIRNGKMLPFYHKMIQKHFRRK